jgi:DNA polymerase-3 subunit delta
MLIKLHELKTFKKKNFNYYLFFGPNIDLIEETIEKIYKPIFSKNIFNYDEEEILKNSNEFKEMIFNKSFFEDDKFIIINKATNKILEIIQEIVSSGLKDLKIIIKAGLLEKKSKLRNYFEKKDDVIATAFYEDTHQSLLLMVQNILKDKKTNISSEIINLIIEKSKGSRINIANELEKILTFNKNKKSVLLQDVLKLTNLAENYSISELVDQSLAKNVKKTIKIINENILNTEENVLILRSFLSKLKRLKRLKIDFEKSKNIEQTLSLSKPPIFWKDKIIIKQQLNMRSLSEIKILIKKINNLELTIKKNHQVSDQILNNFILENMNTTNSVV